MEHSPPRLTAVIGAGVIGASWAALFLAKGWDVSAWDPAPDAEVRLRRKVSEFWPALEGFGLAPGASLGRLRFTATLAEAVGSAQFVQENGPERLNLKRELFAELDRAAPPEAILASSSSTLMPSEFQDTCARHPERVVLGHPFNPPHLIPLVEVVGGRSTAASAVDRALAFYRAVGRHPIRLRREARGHVASRLQTALFQEAFHLVEAGYASVEDVDAAVTYGPGLRWALLGPFANLHLSGGEGGIAALFDKPLWRATEELWHELGKVEGSAALRARVVEGVAVEMSGVDTDELMRRRDRLLVELLRLKAAEAEPHGQEGGRRGQS